MQLQELVDVLNRPRIRKYISESQAEEFLDLLCEVAFIVEPKQGAAICRDPKTTICSIQPSLQKRII